MALQDPHITVACVVERDGQYLIVEERDKSSGNMVLNQPAGHVEAGETLMQAAVRETREETAWEVALIGVIGVSLYVPDSSGASYFRTTFAATGLHELPDAELDPDIYKVHWLDHTTLQRSSARMRSPLVLASIERHRQGHCYPLDILYPQ